MATTKIITEVTDLNAASSTNGLKMPTGGAYSGTPTDGMVRNSSETGSQGSANVMQHFNGTGWKNYENLSNTFTADFLIVAGGGGGGPNHGGGGGAGGYLTTTTYSGSETPLAASLGTAYNVTVGPGGVGGTSGIPGTSGSNSEFNGITSTGGGGGAINNGAGVLGGSGGGGSRGGSGGLGTTGQGNDGAAGASLSGGGGGGASAAGSTGSTYVGGNGGAGTANSITGTSVFYAGGGGGNGYTASGGTGGVGGGGNGGQYGGGGEYIGTNGALNTGGGGGGNYSNSGTFQEQGMLGGSGIVILRYPTADVSSYAVTGTLDTVADTAYPIANTAYYKLEGGSGTTVTDSSGNGYNGTATSVTYAAGRFGQAAVFNGSSSEIVAPNSLLPSSGGFSISWWQKTTQADNTYSYTMDNSGGSAQNGIYIITHNVSTGFIVGFKNSSVFQPIIPYSSVERTQWTHFCISWDGTTSTDAFKIYKNNVPTSFTSSVTNGGGSYPFRIGRSYNGTDWFGGSIDQVRIFNSAISAANVTSLYNEGTVVESTDGTDSILQFIGGTGTVTFS